MARIDDAARTLDAVGHAARFGRSPRGVSVDPRRRRTRRDERQVPDALHARPGVLHAVLDAVQSVSEKLQAVPGAEVPLELLSKVGELGRSASAGTLAELVREALHR